MKNLAKTVSDGYSATAINVATGAEKHRLDVARYLGAKDYVGVENQLFEIIDNAVDENITYYKMVLDILRSANIDYTPQPRKIWIVIKDDWSVTVRDQGRGVPLGMHPTEKVRACYLVYESDSAGGKGGHNQGGYGNDTSGMHGAGAAVACSCSEWFRVTVATTGFHDEVTGEDIAPGVYLFGYLEGKRETELVRVGDIEQSYDEGLRPYGYMETYTQVDYKYKEGLFDTTYLGTITEPYLKNKILERLKYMLIGSSDLNSIEIYFKFRDDEEIVIRPSEFTAEDFLYASNKEDLLSFSVESDLPKTQDDYFSAKVYIYRDPSMLSFSSKTILNRLVLDRAASNTAVEKSLKELYNEALTAQFGNIRTNKLASVVKEYVDRHRVLIVMSMTRPSFTGQTKRDLASVGFSNEMGVKIKNVFYRVVDSYFKKYIDSASAEITSFLKSQEEAKKAEEALKKQRQAVQKNIQWQSEIEKAAKDPAYRLKLFNGNVDSARDRFTLQKSVYEPEDCYLVIVEGQSAANVIGDFSNFPIYVFGLLGKPKNVQNETNLVNEIQFNQLKTLILCLLMNFKGIYIVTDADPDGHHIRILVTAIIMKYAPHYLTDGKTYIINSPYTHLINRGNTPVTIDEGMPSAKVINPGVDVYSISQTESERWVKAGLSVITKYGGLSDSLSDDNDISLKKLISDPRYKSKIKPPTVNDVAIMNDILSKDSYLKKEFSSSICTDRLIFLKNISSRPKDLKVDVDFRSSFLSTQPTISGHELYRLGRGANVW